MHISSSVEQKSTHLCALPAHSKVQRCLVVVIFVIQFSSSVNQDSTHFRAFAVDSSAKRGVLFFILRIQVCTSVEQKGTAPYAVAAASKVQSSTSSIRVGECASSVDEEGAQLWGVFFNSNFERCMVGAVFGMHVSSTVEEKCTQLCASLLNSHVKRCLPVIVQIIHTTSSTSVEQEGAQLDVLLLYCHVKRRHLTRRTNYTGIKIQPTETQVFVPRSVNEPIHIDITTLLAQRG
eukprot:Rhum_TRINITY_DN15214_c1_g1::Rhum_TRINITY_DN15214_c1_g1_i1::g.144572::m.144572